MNMNLTSPHSVQSVHGHPAYTVDLTQAAAAVAMAAHGHGHGPTPLSRTDSSTSFSSEEDASMSSSTITVINSSRRTRKRFTNAQLTMLENLFHLNSHPSREDRENVAKEGGMEIKSVTIWFQNKRQTERKTAASNNGGVVSGSNSGGSHATSHAVPNITSTIHTFSLHGDSSSTSTSRTASPPFSISSRSTTSTNSTSNSHTSSRPSLDRVASRSELRAAAPRTPSRRPSHPSTGTIWDNMPSSPLAPPISPPAREFIDFGKHAKTRRTLEWACAAARLMDKDGYASGMTAGFGGLNSGGGAASASVSVSANGGPSKVRGRTVSREKLRLRGHQGRDAGTQDRDGADNDLTDEEDQEAITPPSTWDKDDRRWMAPVSDGGHSSLMAMTEVAVSGARPKDIRLEDDDMFKAALALCGLGRRT